MKPEWLWVVNSWSQVIHYIILLSYMFDSYEKFKETGGRQIRSEMTEEGKENEQVLMYAGHSHI